MHKEHKIDVEQAHQSPNLAERRLGFTIDDFFEDAGFLPDFVYLSPQDFKKCWPAPGDGYTLYVRQVPIGIRWRASLPPGRAIAKKGLAECYMDIRKARKGSIATPACGKSIDQEPNTALNAEKS